MFDTVLSIEETSNLSFAANWQCCLRILIGFDLNMLQPNHHPQTKETKQDTPLHPADLNLPSEWVLRQASGSPHVTTLPSLTIAANASPAAWIWWTSCNCPWTALESPPQSGCPQVMTVLSSLKAANAPPEAWIPVTFCSSPCTWLYLYQLIWQTKSSRKEQNKTCMITFEDLPRV